MVVPLASKGKGLFFEDHSLGSGGILYDEGSWFKSFLKNAYVVNRHG
jgi:hypothetical protein